MEHPSCYPDLVPHDFWLFPKIKSTLKGQGQRFQDTEDIQKRCDKGTESSSTTVVLKMFPTVAVLLD
jgi:hypothetical protein